MNIETFAPSSTRDPRTGRLRWQCRFVILPHGMLTHPSLQGLSGGGAKLLLAILAGYMGNNNGHLLATASRMKLHGVTTKEVIARGLEELIAAGLVVRTRTRHLRSPALYAITWLPLDSPAPGDSYDPDVQPGNEALDLWRHGSDCVLGAAA